MQRFVQCCVFILFALLSMQAGAQAAAASAPVKIGFVNYAQIESESTIAKQAAEMLKKEFAPREAQLLEMQKQGNALQNDLEKNSATMPAADRIAKEKRFAAMAQQYQQMQRSLFEDVEARKRETFGSFVTEIMAAIKTVAEAGKYDLVVQQAVFSSPQYDITEQVMKEIAKRTGGK
jgi:outer membrane protein